MNKLDWIGSICNKLDQTGFRSSYICCIGAEFCIVHPKDLYPGLTNDTVLNVSVQSPIDIIVPRRGALKTTAPSPRGIFIVEEDAEREYPKIRIAGL